MEHLTKSVTSRHVLDDSDFFASGMSMERKGTAREIPRPPGRRLWKVLLAFYKGTNSLL